MHFTPASPSSWYSLPRAGGVAYAAQESWVLNETIRDNILFGSEYDEERYKKVLYQCALERDLELLGVTGVEDKLQKDVKPSLELLRNAGIKIWMLTGDKVETARCVAVSSKLVARGQYIHTIQKRTSPLPPSQPQHLLTSGQ